MQPHKRSRPAAQMHPQDVHALRQSIPWWGDIGPDVSAELNLPSLEEVSPLSAQPFGVVVIGGGVTGLNAALCARTLGLQVLLLEREACLGYGATGRNAGILSAGVNMALADVPEDSPVAAFWPETTRELLSLVDEARKPGAILSARLTGSISLAESRNAAHHLEREARARLDADLRAELWTPAQVAEATAGRLNVSSVRNALWLPDEGRIHPLTLLAHLAKQARAAGVQFAGQACVAAYEEQGSLWQITLASGTTLSTRGLISAVGPTAAPNARIYALAFTIDLPPDFPDFWDASPYTYTDFRAGNGRIGASGGRYGKAGITKHDASYHRRMAEAARHWLPELADKAPLFTWAVDLAVSADMIPQLRPLGKVAPGFAIEGLGALGVLPGTLLGRRAAEAIVQCLD